VKFAPICVDNAFATRFPSLANGSSASLLGARTKDGQDGPANHRFTAVRWLEPGLALPASGEGWHKSCRASPDSARHCLAWYQNDSEAGGICLLAFSAESKRMVSDSVSLPTGGTARFCCRIIRRTR
jgi:hypothetical protein